MGERGGVGQRQGLLPDLLTVVLLSPADSLGSDRPSHALLFFSPPGPSLACSPRSEHAISPDLPVFNYCATFSKVTP